jgi:hypothetical protein
MRVLSIDGWRDGDGWQWNNWHSVGEFPNTSADMLDKPRALLRWFREAGYLADSSRGRVAIEDDGYNVVILDKDTREPLYALEYGALETAHFVLFNSSARGVVYFVSDNGSRGSNPNTTPRKLAEYLRELHSDKLVSIEVLS